MMVSVFIPEPLYKDKAISAGEEAYIDIKNSKIDEVGVGIASKDGSHVYVFKSSIKNTEFSPAMTYVKKSFYGLPELIIESTEIDNKKVIAQTGTRLIIDGVNIKTQNINVEKMYNSTVMQK